MSAAEVDEYLAQAPEPQRTTLAAVRTTLEALLPEATQGISYGVPTFKVRGKGVAGFASFTKHCGYLPMSGSVVAALGDRLTGYRTTKGSVQFPVDEPLPADLVEALVTARLAELGIGR